MLGRRSPRESGAEDQESPGIPRLSWQEQRLSPGLSEQPAYFLHLSWLLQGDFREISFSFLQGDFRSRVQQGVSRSQGSSLLLGLCWVGLAWKGETSTALTVVTVTAWQ